MTNNRAFLEILCVHEIFLRLGFKAGEIYVGVDDHCIVGVTLKPAGAQTDFAIGPFKPGFETPDETLAKWAEAVGQWNAAPAEERTAIFNNSWSAQNAVHVICELVIRGLYRPSPNKGLLD